jgi:DNA-binding MarR family transcriptional regulator
MTPVLKKLESKGYISRTRSTEDERSVVVSLTEKGEALKEQAMHIPGQLDECVKLTREEAAQLHSLLYKTLGTLN